MAKRFVDEQERAYPTGRILKSIRSKNWTVSSAIFELLDNALGEQRGNAPNVWMMWNPANRVLTVLDDGKGMRNVSHLFIFGAGVEERHGGDTGLYGVGGSEAGAWLSDQQDVWTLKRGKVAHMKANWARCEERREFPVITGDWVTATPANCPTELLEVEHGTLIRLVMRHGLQVRPEDIHAKVSRVFSVGLRHGRRLTWTTETKSGPIETQIREWNPGKLEDAITATVTLMNGWTARVHAGRVENLSIENSKLSVNFVYRQIKTTSQGFGRPVQGATGQVDLGLEWLEALTTTKENIREEYRAQEDELMTLIEVILRPLVDKLREAKRSKIFNNVKMNLKYRFEGAHTTVVDGKKRPSGDGSRGSEAPGPDQTPRPKRAVLPAVAEIRIDKLTDEQIGGLLCRADLSNPNVAMAWVNEDHSLIQTALEAEPVNQRLLEQILVNALAIEILSFPDGLVRFGLLDKKHAQALLDAKGGDKLAVLLEVIRILTDRVIPEDEAA